MNRIRKSIYIIPMAVVIIACSVATPAALPTIMPSEATQSAKIVMSATMPPTQISSSTPTVPIPTWTPLPTLENTRGVLDFISLFTEKSICDLPCWVNITPGVTDWEEAQYYLSQLASATKYKILTNQDSVFGKTNAIMWSAVDGEMKLNGIVATKLTGDNTVHMVTLTISSSSLPKDFDLQSLLMQYGKPSMIFLSTDIGAQEPLALALMLVFPDNQFYVIYHRLAKLSGNDVVSCTPNYYMEFFLVDNKDQLTTIDAIANAPETTKLNITSWDLLEEVTNTTIDEFYVMHSKENTACIISPSKYWQ